MLTSLLRRGGRRSGPPKPPQLPANKDGGEIDGWANGNQLNERFMNIFTGWTFDMIDLQKWHLASIILVQDREI